MGSSSVSLHRIALAEVIPRPDEMDRLSREAGLPVMMVSDCEVRRCFFVDDAVMRLGADGRRLKMVRGGHERYMNRPEFVERTQLVKASVTVGRRATKSQGAKRIPRRWQMSVKH